jgi:hypothetical protein
MSSKQGRWPIQAGRAALFNREWTRIDANKGIPFTFIGVYSWFIIVFSLGRSLPDITQSSVGSHLTNSRSPLQSKFRWQFFRVEHQVVGSLFRSDVLRAKRGCKVFDL